MQSFWKLARIVMAATLLACLPFFPPYVKHLAFLALNYSVLALSLNLVTGYIGQVSLGHAAFYGVGAFVSAILTLHKVNFWVAFPLAGILAGLIGIPLGLPALRVKGHFLVVVTYGFAEVLRFLALNMEITGGPAGLPGVPQPVLLKPFSDIGPTGKEAYIVFAAVLALFLAYLITRLENSRVGLAFSAIREDEIAAGAMGVNQAYYKLLAFSLSALFAGLAGSLYAHYCSFISSEVFGSAESILMLTMVVVGGTRSVPGSFLGAALLATAPDALRYVKDLLNLPYDPWLVLYGLLIILMMKFRPQGLLGTAAPFR